MWHRGAVENGGAGAAPPLSRGSRSLLVIGILMMSVVVAAIGVMILQLHRDDLAEAQQNVSKLGIAISEQTARSMQAGDLVLADLTKQIAALNVHDAAAFKAVLANPEMFRFLKDRADFLPQVDAFTIIAADGKLVNFSRQWPMPATDLSDRDYVRMVPHARRSRRRSSARRCRTAAMASGRPMSCGG